MDERESKQGIQRRNKEEGMREEKVGEGEGEREAQC